MVAGRSSSSAAPSRAQRRSRRSATLMLRVPSSTRVVEVAELAAVPDLDRPAVAALVLADAARPRGCSRRRRTARCRRCRSTSSRPGGGPAARAAARRASPSASRSRPAPRPRPSPRGSGAARRACAASRPAGRRGRRSRSTRQALEAVEDVGEDPVEAVDVALVLHQRGAGEEVEALGVVERRGRRRAPRGSRGTRASETGTWAARSSAKKRAYIGRQRPRRAEQRPTRTSVGRAKRDAVDGGVLQLVEPVAAAARRRAASRRARRGRRRAASSMAPSLLLEAGAARRAAPARARAPRRCRRSHSAPSAGCRGGRPGPPRLSPRPASASALIDRRPARRIAFCPATRRRRVAVGELDRGLVLAGAERRAPRGAPRPARCAGRRGRTRVDEELVGLGEVARRRRGVAAQARAGRGSAARRRAGGRPGASRRRSGWRASRRPAASRAAASRDSAASIAVAQALRFRGWRGWRRQAAALRVHPVEHPGQHRRHLGAGHAAAAAPAGRARAGSVMSKGVAMPWKLSSFQIESGRR